MNYTEKLAELEEIKKQLHFILVEGANIEPDICIAIDMVRDAITKIIVSDEYQEELAQSQYDTEIENKIDYELENQ
jgi:hypothetical protein